MVQVVRRLSACFEISLCPEGGRSASECVKLSANPNVGAKLSSQYRQLYRIILQEQYLLMSLTIILKLLQNSGVTS